jgi:hypothetical protein
MDFFDHLDPKYLRCSPLWLQLLAVILLTVGLLFLYVAEFERHERKNEDYKLVKANDVSVVGSDVLFRIIVVQCNNAAQTLIANG